MVEEASKLSSAVLCATPMACGCRWAEMGGRTAYLDILPKGTG
jgi:hypothetical protein